MRAGNGCGAPASFSPRAAMARTRESCSCALVVGGAIQEEVPLHELQRNATNSREIGLQRLFLFEMGDFDDKLYRCLATGY